MNKSTILTPGCSEPIVLEPCEVEWLRSTWGFLRRGEMTGLTVWERGDRTVHGYIVAAVYECALYNMVMAHLEPQGGKAELHLYTGRASVYIYDCFGFGIERNEHEGPTPLHAWRAAAKHLCAGPWDPNRKDS